MQPTSVSIPWTAAVAVPQAGWGEDETWPAVVVAGLFFVGVAWICRPRRQSADVVVRRPTVFEQHLVTLTEMPTVADAERYAARLRALGIVALPKAEPVERGSRRSVVPSIVVVSTELERAHEALDRLIAQDLPAAGQATTAEIERELAEAAADDDDPIDADVGPGPLQRRIDRLFGLLASRWLWLGLALLFVAAVVYRWFVQ